MMMSLPLCRMKPAVDHVDGGYFAFGLKHDHAGGFPWHEGFEGLEHF